MQLATALLVASLWGAAPAGAHARAKRPLAQTIRAARRECSRPGPKLAELVERSFDGLVFGKRVVPGWDQLSQEQRDAFAVLADAVFGPDKRQG